MVPFLHITTRLEDQPEDDLLSDLTMRVSFPTILMLNASGETVAVLTNDRSLAGFEWMREKVAAMPALTKKAAAGDAAARIELAFLRVETGADDFYDLEDVVAMDALDAAGRKRLRRLEANTNVSEVSQMLQRSRNGAQVLGDAAEAFLEFHAEGAHPTVPGWRRLYWRTLARHAAAKKDAKLLAECVDGLAAAGARAGLVKKLRDDLAQLKTD